MKGRQNCLFLFLLLWTAMFPVKNIFGSTFKKNIFILKIKNHFFQNEKIYFLSIQKKGFVLSRVFHKNKKTFFLSQKESNFLQNTILASVWKRTHKNNKNCKHPILQITLPQTQENIIFCKKGAWKMISELETLFENHP